MSARDGLRLVLQDSFGSDYEESDTDRLYGHIRDEVAHELAEEIRADADWDEEHGEKWRVIEGKRDAADLIDPACSEAAAQACGSAAKQEAEK